MGGGGVLPSPSPTNTRYPSFAVEVRYSFVPGQKGHIVQGTRRTRDASDKGRVGQGTQHLRDALFTGRIVQGTEHPRLFLRRHIGRGYFITSSQLISVTASAKATLHLSPSSIRVQHKNGLNIKNSCTDTSHKQHKIFKSG